MQYLSNFQKSFSTALPMILIWLERGDRLHEKRDKDMCTFEAQIIHDRQRVVNPNGCVINIKSFR